MVSVTICSQWRCLGPFLGTQENKMSRFPFFPHLFAMKWWNQMPWSQFFWMLSFTLSSFSLITSVQFSCSFMSDFMDCSTPGLPVHHQLPEFTQTHIHWVGDAIQPSHPLSSPSPPTFNLSQDQGLYQGVSSSHQVAKVLKFQLQDQSFQWLFRTDFL